MPNYICKKINNLENFENTPNTPNTSCCPHLQLDLDCVKRVPDHELRRAGRRACRQVLRVCARA